MSWKLNVAGIMSGTSLDGVDIAHVTLYYHQQQFSFQLNKAITLPYPTEWINKLRSATSLNGLQLSMLNNTLGYYIGKLVHEFLQKNTLETDLIASHGHTVFHQPEKQLTLQIGNGACIASETNLTTISDFRVLDIAYGGQGAPLVPIGDELLFHHYDACLNLGGFSNISIKRNQKRIAFDICPCNLILNNIANAENLPYDIDGNLGRKGFKKPQLLKLLNNLDYYNLEAPKSLGVEWLENHFNKTFQQSNSNNLDLISTFYEHISDQIAMVLNNYSVENVLVTGGGAFNKYLIERIQDKTKTQLVIPDDSIINYKEAIVFALMGALRYKNMNNTLHEATGASRSISCGVIHLT